MKIHYDPEVDILYIQIRDAKVADSEEEPPGVVLDYAEDREIVGIELHHASEVIAHLNPVWKAA